MKNKIKISEMIAIHLKNIGVQKVFGVPGGGSSLDLIDAFDKVDIEVIEYNLEKIPNQNKVRSSFVIKNIGKNKFVLNLDSSTEVGGMFSSHSVFQSYFGMMGKWSLDLNLKEH